MKILFLFFIFIFSKGLSQQCNGHIFDDKNIAIQNVNVYLDGTTFATQTDVNGQFLLHYDSVSTRVLVVSCIGYQTMYLSNYNNIGDLIINLKPAIIELNTVTINCDAFPRKQKLKLFRNEFLGRTPNGKNCVIENEKAIYFVYNKKLRSLQAFANEPLVVINKNLGYKIYIDLLGFEATFYRTNLNPSEMYRCYYAVLSHFEETSNSEKYQKRRFKAYNESQLHFFRNMANNLWDKNNFMLYFGTFPANPANFFEIEVDGYLSTVAVKTDAKSVTKKVVASFDVVFEDKKQSAITFETSTFTIDHFGNNSHIKNIIISGALSEQKVGCMVPMNYGLK